MTASAADDRILTDRALRYSLDLVGEADAMRAGTPPAAEPEHTA